MNRTKKRLKIAFDASPLLVNKTGVAYYIERLVIQLAQQYPDVELVGFYYNFLGKRSAKHFPQAPNIRYRPIRFIPSKVVYQIRRWGIELPLELLTKEHVDFVLYGNFHGYPSLQRTPAAPVVHDLTYIDLPDYVTAKNRSDLTRFVPRQIARSQFVITVSEFSKQRIIDEYQVNPEDILVTPIPPVPDAVQLSDEQRKHELQSLGITKPYILFVSTIEPRKNAPALVDAYKQLPAELRERFSLVFVGRTGWNCDEDIAHITAAQEEGFDIIRTGYVSDEARTAVFASATIFALASHYEGFGMPVLEAMKHRLACAISDIPVFHEVAGDAALYFDQNNPTEIAAALTELLTNDELRAQKAADSYQRATTAFSWEENAKQCMARIVQTIQGSKTDKTA